MRQPNSLFNHSCEFINSIPVGKTFTSAEYIAAIGHRENVDSLRRIFSSWISNGVCQQSWKQKTFFQPCFKPQKPLFLHLSGPSGVGKTLFSDRVSSVLFKERRTDEHDQQRELHHCGHFMYYLSSLQNNSDFVDFLDAVDAAAAIGIAGGLVGDQRQVQHQART